MEHYRWWIGGGEGLYYEMGSQLLFTITWRSQEQRLQLKNLCQKEKIYLWLSSSMTDEDSERCYCYHFCEWKKIGNRPSLEDRAYKIFDGLDVGTDTGSPVDFKYKLPFSYTGKIEKVVIDTN